MLGLECIDGFILADNNCVIRFDKLFGGKHYPPDMNENGRMIIRVENWSEDFEKVSNINYKMYKYTKGICPHSDYVNNRVISRPKKFYNI